MKEPSAGNSSEIGRERGLRAARGVKDIFPLFAHWRLAVLSLVWIRLMPQMAEGAPLLRVERSADGSKVEIKVTAVKTTGPGLLEVLDAKTGRCLRTLHAGVFSAGQQFSIGQKQKLGTGRYRVRYREGIKLVYDSAILLPGKEKWTNPTDLQITDKAVYVLDSGRLPPPRKPDEPPADATAEEDPANHSYLFKFHRDGKPDAAFGDRGRASVLPTATWLRAFTVDQEGHIYLGDGGTSHHVRVLSAVGEDLK